MRQENERFRGEVDGLRPATVPPEAPPRRVRRVSAWVVVLVVACLLAVVAHRPAIAPPS